MPLDTFRWKGGAGRKVNTALPSQLPGKIVNPPGGGEGQGTGVSRVTKIGTTGHSVTQPSQVGGNATIGNTGQLPDGVQDAQWAHDRADLLKMGNGSTETHPRGPEWMRQRLRSYQEEQFRTTLLPGDQGEGNK